KNNDGEEDGTNDGKYRTWFRKSARIRIRETLRSACHPARASSATVRMACGGLSRPSRQPGRKPCIWRACRRDRLGDMDVRVGPAAAVHRIDHRILPARTAARRRIV